MVTKCFRAEKKELLILLGEGGSKKSFRVPAVLEQDPKDKEYISMAKRGKKISNRENTTGKDTEELNALQIAHHHPPDNLDRDPLPVLWHLLHPQ